MSIVIADNNNIADFYIISDTKIVIDESSIPYTIPPKLAFNIQKYGLIKTIIINNYFVVGFAGDIIVANEFIGYLRYISSQNADPIEMLKIAKLYYDNNIKSTESKCDFLIAIYYLENISLYKFSDNNSCVSIKRGYIGDSSVYKNFMDYSEMIIPPKKELISSNKVLVEVQVKFHDITIDGEKYQNTEAMRSDINKLKEIVDRGGNTYVGSPIIGVYFNMERKQFEYLTDKVYNVHGELSTNGEATSININQYHSGESYDISPVLFNQGIVITYWNFALNVAYLYTYDYKDLGINDLEYLLLPLPKKGRCNVKIDYRK